MKKIEKVKDSCSTKTELYAMLVYYIHKLNINHEEQFKIGTEGCGQTVQLSCVKIKRNIIRLIFQYIFLYFINT